MSENKNYLDTDDIFDDNDIDLDNSEEQVIETKEDKVEHIDVKQNIKQNNEVQTNPQETKPIEKNIKSKKDNKKTKTKPITVKKLLSISKKNSDVIDILKKAVEEGFVNSESDYICEAIREKYERDKEFKDTDLRLMVKSILDDMIGSNYIILKGDSNSNITTTNNIKQNNEETINKELDQDAKDAVKNLMQSWDDEEE